MNYEERDGYADEVSRLTVSITVLAYHEDSWH